MGSIARRDLLTWGAGVGAAAALGSGLVLPSAARAGTRATAGTTRATARTARATAGTTPGGLPTDDWMGRLDGNLPLLDLTIPGTHDSCCENPGYGTEWSHTQNWGIPQQLREGVRFLDIRCNGLQGAPDELGIYHSDSYQHLRLQDVLDQCRTFLRAHSGETVVMRLRNERAGGQALGDDEFMRRIDCCFDEFGFRDLFHLHGWPTLGAARGKVVLLADFANPWGLIDWSSGRNEYFDTQDVWQIGGSDPLGTKGQYIVAQFDKASRTPGTATMFVNFLSYAGGYWPKYSSQALMDRSIYPYLNARTQQPGRFGIVPMDFPDFHVNVLQMLIDRNVIPPGAHRATTAGALRIGPGM